MSIDQRVTQDLIKTLQDGKDGYEAAADRLDENGRADIAMQFRAYAKQRQEFTDELHTIAARYGDGEEIEQTGTVAAAVHRGWMALRDTLAGSDPDGVLDVAAEGEDYALAEFSRALGEDISADLRAVVAGMRAEIERAQDAVKGFRDAA